MCAADWQPTSECSSLQTAIDRHTGLVSPHQSHALVKGVPGTIPAQDALAVGLLEHGQVTIFSTGGYSRCSRS